VDDVIPIDRTPGLPSPERDQQDAESPAELEAKAKLTLEFHRRGLDARRLRDLTVEKYLLHIDGEGDSQWYDVYAGTRLQMIPVLDGVSPVQDNQLRPITDNFVAHLTSQAFRFVVEFKPDRQSRQAALVDQAIINNEVKVQKWNSLFATAKYIACAAGWCPIHSMWRDDADTDAYEGVMPGAMPGHIDSWVGDPLAHVVNSAAVRGSAGRQTFARTLPADLVRAAFPHIKIEGTTKVPSASLFQRVINKWVRTSGVTHGHAELSAGHGHEEMIALVYDEILPGYDSRYPEGSLCIVALQGAATANSEDTRSPRGTAKHLWSGQLPAGVFSSVPVYSHHRFDDYYGKPYVSDLDDDQIELNQRLALLKEYQRRAARPPLGGSGDVTVDTVGFEGDTFFEVDPVVGASTMDLQYLKYPADHVPVLLEEIQMIYERMYRKAGWQAASRGETTSDSGKAIIALQQADDSIMGPISQRTSEEACDLAVLNWRLRKQFMDAPTVLEHIGDELSHMAEPYIDRTMMSETPPQFKLVSGFGTSTEAKAQQLLNLLTVTDPLGEPVLTATQFKKQFPDQSLYSETDDPSDVRERRPRVVNEIIRQVAEGKANELMAQFTGPDGQPQWQPSMADPWTDELGRIVEMEVAQIEDVLLDDDMELNIETLSIITQDTTEHPVARRAAIHRQIRYFMWLQGQQQASAQQQMEQQAGVAQMKAGAPQPEEAFNPANEGGSPTAQSMVQADKNFEKEIA